MLLSAVLSFTVLLPGILVIVNRRSEYREWLFLFMSFFLSLWVFSNYLVDNDLLRSLFWARTTFFAIVWTCFFFLEFTQHFPDNKPLRSLWRRVSLLVTILIALLTYTPVFLPGVVLNGSVVELVQGSLYPVFLLYYPAILIPAFTLLVSGLRRSKGVARSRVRIVLGSLVSMTLLTSTTNLILPELFNYTGLVQYGGFATVLLTVGVAYAMMKHHLFDIRAAVARTLAYALSVGVIIASYSVATFTFSNLLSIQIKSEAGQRIVYVLFVALVALLFQPLKRFFDKVTNRIFFQDSYDPQQVLDKLSDLLVGTIELEQLLQSSSQLISSSLKTGLCVFILTDTDESMPRSFGLSNTKTTPQRISVLTQHLADTRLPVIKDELDDMKLRHMMGSIGAHYITQMSTKTEMLGYIVLGEKKNGNPYTSQDMSLLSIISDELALGLENALRFEQIEDFTVTLQKKIDEATRELRRSNQKLQALDEAKDEFISMASHQLRTPLTSIKGYLSMVLEGDVGDVPDAQKEMLQTAYTSAQHMVYLIADLLNVSRLQTGKFVIEPVETNLAQVVEEELSQLKEVAAAKSITIHYQKPSDFPTVRLDETKIRQVIMNFADNAVYYTPVGGSIDVRLLVTGKTLEFSVTDTGIGVPKTEQHKLFEKFYRAGNARKARPDGTGLGLFMAKKVIVASGGAIIFHSREGKGSTFGFTFVLSKIAG